MAELATIARPYAEALFKATGTAGAEQTQQWLDVFAEAAADADVLRVAQSPKVTQAQIEHLFEGLVQGALPQLAKNFLAAVIDNGRLPALPLVAAQYRELVNDQEGAADAVIFSAFPIGKSEVEALRPGLEKRFGRKLNLTVQTDASLIGGVRVVVGDEEFDTSVKARLEQMKVALTA